MSPEEIARRRAEFDKQKEVAKNLREDLGLQRAKATAKASGGMTQPFAGVRILDFTQVFAGPFGSYQLALLGADVIKIERPGGDDMRRGPPNKDWSARNLSTGFMAINSNKRNLALDLTKPKAIEIVHRLAAKTDVVMENFRPGVMDKLGIGYEALSGINPKLIYCAMSGFGQNGPERTTAAYDGKIQAMSGIMSVTGHPEIGADAGGLCGVRRHRRHDGGFRGVERALPAHAHGPRPARRRGHAGRDAGVPRHLRHRLHGRRPRAGPARQPRAEPAADGGRVQVKGGHILLAVNNEKQFVALSRAIGQPDLPRTRASSTGRRALPTTRRCAPSSRTCSPSRRQDLGGAADRRATCPARGCGPSPRSWLIRSSPIATSCSASKPPTARMTLVGSGFRLAHGGGSIERPPAMPGEHAEEVLGEAGYGEAEIAALRRDGAI